MVVALVADLIFQSKIAGVAAHLGIEARFERSIAGARSAAESATGVLLDLTVDEGDSIELIRDLRQANPVLRIVGFFPHVQAELARQAREAGASQVLPRSRCTEQLAQILQGLAQESTASRPAPPSGDSSVADSDRESAI